MKALCFYWDESETLKADMRAQKRLLKQWTHTAKAFGISKLLIIGDQVPVINDTEITIEVFKSYEYVRHCYDDYLYVVITEKGMDIEEINIPYSDNMLFVVGSNYSNPVEYEGDLLVGINANVPLWDVVAAGIVLHRSMQWL